MLQGLFAAASGMAAQQERIDAVANDMSNLDTTGYQAQRVGFRDLLYTSGGADNNMSVATGAGAAARVFGRSEAQGSINYTHLPLDVALNGEGYIAVAQANGSVGLTRNGSFQLDLQGRIVNSQGLSLSPPVAVPPGTHPDQITIGTDGTVKVNNVTVGQIRVVTVPSPDNLLAQGNGLFSPTAASGAIRPANGTTITQGALEASNVDVNQAMTDLIDAQRTYSMASKAIEYQNQMLQIANGVKK